MTADDLVAVQMLSVLVPGPVALNLLEGELGEQVAHHLAVIPVGVAINDAAAAALIGPAGPATAAWQLLEQQYDVGWVTAGKLLARKRPGLIPVGTVWSGAPWATRRLRPCGCGFTNE